ncbi:hypothetical protein Bca52824_024333 [Brassica carinata]|uniref:Phosphoenolpyruvate carboxylase n=1 Tax=Brassica carinata TaxID=52824 RepID=A0A8X7VK80_BRACI|nr:hypothetical protein Bca52824_024333 [Brassica carinata]
MRAGMSYFQKMIWNGVKFLRRVDTELKNIGIDEHVPYNAPLIQFSSWMGGDRDGNPRVTPELSMWRCTDEFRAKADEIDSNSMKDAAKNYIEFLKTTPPTEPYRVIPGDFLEPLELCYRSLCSCGDRPIADVSTFGLSFIRLDIRQESERHTDVLDAITKHLDGSSYRDWSAERRQEWLLAELSGKRPLFGPDLPKTEEIADVLDTFKVISELPSESSPWQLHLVMSLLLSFDSASAT